MRKPQNPLNDRQIKAIDDAMIVCGNRLSPFSLPIYKHKVKGPPEAIGTGFVVDYFGTCYFVSAAHVMDYHETEEPLFYFVNKLDRQYIKGKSRTSSKDSAGRNNDKIDVTVVKLPDGEGRPDETVNHSVISRDMITPDTTKIDDCRFIVAGYPVTRQKVDYKNKLLNMNCYFWIGKSIQNEIYLKLNIDKSQNLLIQFERKNIKRSDNIADSQFPEPQGISGSPVWHTVGYRNEEKILVIENVLLAGLLIEHMPKSKALLATSINIVLSMIIDLHNDVD